ncbi:GNAT family N-acetyltransferase [Pseudomonas monteilii]|uniref:GNAT family N-acetyltransferase n=1 Tax=Pseudomonas TaxID=286 RepID=UPI0018E6C938|nr:MULTISPECIES: GNAT family N-acetyltransferase [Pseudomonas]MBI6920976.1 GNAT family N-acetyltransferase [Pseudomonas monteilii]MCE0935595.1 GNAT family N-acetyltransferase [Pseudomonas kurunegalensis]
MIRLAVATDEPEVRQCAEQAYARYVPLIGRKPAPMTADFARQIADGVVYVATDDRAVFQGFIVFYAEHGHMLLENVAVLPSAAGQGVGKALIRFCEDAARQQGVGAVHLYTNEKMTQNLSIYPKLGYVNVGQRTEDGFKRVYFEKTLVP